MGCCVFGWLYFRFDFNFHIGLRSESSRAFAADADARHREAGDGLELRYDIEDVAFRLLPECADVLNRWLLILLLFWHLSIVFVSALCTPCNNSRGRQKHGG